MVQVSELTGSALDWAVAKCEYPEPDYEPEQWEGFVTPGCSDDGWVFTPSTNWAQGGPIIEREGIDLYQSGTWLAEKQTSNEPTMVSGNGDTPLVAAMRCYVASKLGDTVDLKEIYMGEDSLEPDDE